MIFPAVLIGFLAAAKAADLVINPKYFVGFVNPTVAPSSGGKATCITGLIEVSASTDKNIALNFDFPANQTQVTETFLEFVTAPSDLFARIGGPTATVSGTYNISSTLCYPKGQGIDGSSVQILTHGVGFAKAYWDFAQGYSYADVAAKAGRTTFFYDRLGVGSSSTPNAIEIVQAPFEVAILQSLITQLRAGKIATTSFRKVVGVGHSFGSALTIGVAHDTPSLLDAVVLTGFSLSQVGIPIFISALNLAIARQNQPSRFANRGRGYIVSDTIISNQFAFYKAPNFDPAILSLAEATKGPTTFGELFTLTNVINPATNYTGPVDVVDGENDLPFCNGNCLAPQNQAAAVQPVLFPMASNSSNYIAPGAGHAINTHYAAVGAFQHIQSFLAGNGL